MESIQDISFTSIEPCHPVAAYIGGKRGLAKTLIERIETVPHTTYAEPFIGMAGVFLRRRLIPKAEVINDISVDIANFFRVLQRHYVAFMEMMRFQITTRREFERLTETNPDTLTDLERAARFLYLQRTAFGGKKNFGVSPTTSARFNVTKLGPMLEELHQRLAGVVIERLPYQRFIDRYDRPETLFYLDPPYWDCENDYGKGVFSKDDFTHLAKQLATIKGHFIMSLNDTPETRNIFSGFNLEIVGTIYSIGRVREPRNRVSELIISN